MKVLIAALALAISTAPANAGPLPKADAAFNQHSFEEIALGRLLFYDPILSGNRTVSCASCHHPRFATSDGVSLGLGDGGLGLGPERRADPDNTPEQRIARNSPALFNLGASVFTRFFHDGRLEADPSRPAGIRTPLGADMEQGFASPLAAQTMFPVLSPDEMAGHYTENDVAQAVRQGFLTGESGAWSILSNRVEAIPEYRKLFDGVIGDNPIAFTDISNMIAAFVAFEWRADESPFDVYLRGGPPLDVDATAGMELFYGVAGCSACHAGQFQTDHDFHAIAIPQIGPGKAARFERHNRDTGRMRVTGRAADAYRFRTPSLRNVAHTGPYGHSGAYATLRDVVVHHLDPVAGLRGYDPSQVVMPALAGADDFAILNDPTEIDAIARANELPPKSLNEKQIDEILAFLESLTDEHSLTGRLGIPDKVPSGLPIER